MTNPKSPSPETHAVGILCDCERGANGLGIAGRECDCPASKTHVPVPEGYALVPIKPTREMWAAMANTLYGYKNRHHDKVAGDLYKAMLAARPATETHTPATESPWQWWAGSSEEWCTVGPEASRNGIIQAATNDSLGETDDDGSWKLVFHIVEARQDDLRLADWIESGQLLERAEESMADSDRTSSEYDDGPWFECSPEQEKDLEERVKRACDEWQAAHGLKFSCPTFSHTRNKEVVVVDLAIEALSTAPEDGR